MTLLITTPALAKRPLRLSVERAIELPAAEVFRACLEQFNRRCGVPETVLMKTEVNVIYLFANDWVI